jgi:hypothetical protein
LVLELAHWARLLVTKSLGGLLQTADHRRRAAEQDLDIGSRGREPFLQQMLVKTLWHIEW